MRREHDENHLHLPGLVLNCFINFKTMDPQFTFAEELESALHMAHHGHEDSFIETKLMERSLTPEVVDELMLMVKKHKQKKKISLVRQLLFAGVAILGIGFFLCVVFAHSGNSVIIPLYGLTSIGAVLLIIGLARILH